MVFSTGGLRTLLSAALRFALLPEAMEATEHTQFQLTGFPFPSLLPEEAQG